MCSDYKRIVSGILNREQIKHAFDNYDLISQYDDKGLQPCSYDLRVGTIYKEGQMLENDAHSDIDPGEIITIHTLETVKLPKDIAATVFPINSDSSKGFMVLNPGHIDPGYEGILTVRAINLTKNKMSIMCKDKIFTIIFEKLPVETEQGYKNKYLNNEEKKREQLKTERDVSPENIFYIPSHWKKNKVFAYTESDVEKIVNRYWIGIWTMIIAILALFVSVMFFGYAIWRDVRTLPPKTEVMMLDQNNPTDLSEIKPQKEINTKKN